MQTNRPTIRFIEGRVFFDFGDRLLPRIAGGDGDVDLTPLPDELRQRVENVNDAEDTDLAQLEEELLAHLDAVVEPVESGEVSDVEQIDAAIAEAEATRAALDAVRGDAARRMDDAATAEQEAQERRERLAAIRDEAQPEPGDEESEGDEGDGQADDENVDDDEAGEQQEGEQTPPPADVDEAPAGDAENEGEQEARAAGGAGGGNARASHRPSIERVAARRPALRRTQRANLERPQGVLVAAADVNNFSAGQRIPDIEGLAEAIAERADALYGVNSGADGMKYRVARMRADFPEERRLSRDDAGLSTRRMDAATGPQARVATGGLCAPLTPDYSQIGISDARRPLFGAIPHFGADRGGVRWVPPPRFSRGVDGGNAYTAGIGTWTVANDEAPASPATKPFSRVDCDDEQTEVIEATTKRLRIGNFYAMTFRERVQAIMDILDAEFAAVTETKLLDKIKVLSTADITTAKDFGASRDLLSKLDLICAGFENRWRMAENHTPLRLAIPDWVLDMIRADLTRAMNTGRTLEEQLAVTDAQIEQFIRARNVEPIFLVDGETGGNQVFGPQADGAVDGWPNNGDPIAYLWHDGALRIIDAGTLDIGLYRDSTLNNTNDAELFMEEFWNVIFQGWELERITFSLCPDGTSAGTSDADPCATGS